MILGECPVDEDRYQQSLVRLSQFVKDAVQPIFLAGTTVLGPSVQRWWMNPLLSHARRKKPLPQIRLGRWFALSTSGVTLLSIFAWLANLGLLRALLFGTSLGVVLAIGLAAPVLSADRVARQMRFSRQDPRRLTSLEPQGAVWGLALVTLWHLRWLIIIGLVMTPALTIGLLRLDVASFAAWRDSMQALGEAAPAGVSSWLPSDGHIPYFRLVIRALSAGLLPWVMLPLLASLGVTSAVLLRDASLSPLAGLLGAVLFSGLVLLVWEGVSRTPLLAGVLEIVRLILLIGMLVGIGGAAVWVNRRNAMTLVGVPPKHIGAAKS